jgi:hypothetical protein
MKFEITLEEINKVLQALAEMPAKYSFESISILRGLKPLQEKEKNASNE